MKRNKDKLLEHFLRPRNVGIIENADGYSSVENPINGYRTDIYLKISDGIIKDIKFKYAILKHSIYSFVFRPNSNSKNHQ